ncbi:MAG: hypothetical protein ABW215_20465 [Kibdelosporangium sp.]
MVTEETLAALAKWASDEGHPVDVERITALLGLLPGDFAFDSVTELVVAYAKEHPPSSDDEAAEVLSAADDLVAFLADTDRIPEEQASVLDDELESLSSGPDMLAGTDLLAVLEELGLPTESMAPMRLPSLAELGDMARQCEPLALARAYAEGQAPDLVEAELVQLRQYAVAVEFVTVTDDGALEPGPGLEFWPDADDEDVIGTWDAALGALLTESLQLDAELADVGDVEFDSVGPTAFMLLFSVRGNGVLMSDIREVVTEPSPAWDAWAEAHGHPADVIVSRMVALGAATVDDDVVRLTPLSLVSMREQLLEAGIEVPILPPPDAMEADDLLDVVGSYTEEEMEAELTAWLEHRSPEQAASELLEAADDGDPVERIWVSSVVREFGDSVAEPAWRGVLDLPSLRPYAKIALNLELDLDELAGLAVDALWVSQDDDEEFAEALGASLPAGEEEPILEVMWRLDHPEAFAVLTLIGEQHPDKRVGKLARKAAHKASTKVHSSE